MKRQVVVIASARAVKRMNDAEERAKGVCDIACRLSGSLEKEGEDSWVERDHDIGTRSSVK